MNWGYQTYALKGLSVREVQTRSVLMKPGATLMTYQMERDTGDGSRATHLYARWYDWNGNAAKQWWFQTDTAQASVGLATAYEGQSLITGTLTRNDYTWAANSAGKLYVSSNLMTEKLEFHAGAEEDGADVGWVWECDTDTGVWLWEFEHAGGDLQQQLYHFGSAII